MRTRILPRRALQAREYALLLPVAWHLCRAWWEVRSHPASRYLPPDALSPDSASQPLPEQATCLAGVIRGVSGRLPFQCTCLMQALAGYRLLRRRGLEARIVLGVRRGDADTAMAAHAWLLLYGHVLLGGPLPGSFHVLGRS